MTRLLIKLADSQVWISLIATVFYGWACFDAGSNPEWAYTWMLFWGTLGLYTLHDGFLISQKRIWVILSFVLLIIPGFWWWKVTLVKMMIMGVAGLIGILYVVPLTSEQKTLRNFGWAKAMWIALSWTLATAGMAISSIDHVDWKLLVSRFCWVFGLTLLFDYRDRAIDAQHGIKTWGNQMNLAQLKKITAGLYILAILLELSRSSPPSLNSWPVILGLIIAQGLIWIKLKPNVSFYFYTVLLDSTLIWPALLSFLWALV